MSVDRDRSAQLTLLDARLLGGASVTESIRCMQVLTTVPFISPL